MAEPKQKSPPPFRWPKPWQDITLLKEVADVRPTSTGSWDEIAVTLSSVFGVQLKGRGCKEHLDLLIKKFKNEERKALKRSGTEEEYSEIKQLLEDVTTYLDSVPVNTAPPKGKKKEQIDRQKGLEMRHAAMVTHAKRKLQVDDVIDSDDDGDQDNTAGPTPRKRIGTSQMLEFLQKKHESSMKYKQRKLELDERKILLEERRMAQWEATMKTQSFSI